MSTIEYAVEPREALSVLTAGGNGKLVAIPIDQA
jgi:hypothetical protein